jgi:hypothetical protein
MSRPFPFLQFDFHCDWFLLCSPWEFFQINIKPKDLKKFPEPVYKCLQVPRDSLCNLPCFAPIYKNRVAIISKNSTLHSNRYLPSFPYSMKLYKSCVCLLHLYFYIFFCPITVCHHTTQVSQFELRIKNMNLDYALQAELQAYFSNATESSYTNSFLLLSLFYFTA